MVPNEGVRSSLVTDGGQRSVPRMHHRRGVERPKLCVDGIGEQVKITTEIAKLRNSSLTIKQSDWQDDCSVAVGLAVMVHFNYETNRSSPIPADVRVELEKHLIQEVED